MLSAARHALSGNRNEFALTFTIVVALREGVPKASHWAMTRSFAYMTWLLTSSGEPCGIPFANTSGLPSLSTRPSRATVYPSER